MKAELQAELEALADEAKKQGQTLKSERVLEFAEANPASAIHAKVFEEDDAEAARARRLQLCGQLIRTYVKMLPSVNRMTRALCHVPSDKSGYRRVEDVVGNPFWRGEVVNEALDKVGRIRLSYAHLPELDPFFARLDSLIADYRVEMVSARKTG